MPSNRFKKKKSKIYILLTQYEKFKNQNFLQQAKKEQKTKQHKDYEDRMSEGFWSQTNLASNSSYVVLSK